MNKKDGIVEGNNNNNEHAGSEIVSIVRVLLLFLNNK